MNSGRWLHVVALVGGAAATVAGIGLIGAYVVEAVIKRLGEPDQSLLFWYLPLVLFGLMCMMAGIAAASWGIARLRKERGRTR